MTHLVRVLCICLLVGCSINRRSDALDCKTQSDCAPDRTCTDGLCLENNPTDGPVDPPDDGPPVFRCPDQCTSCVQATMTCRVDCGIAAGSAICNQAITCPPGFNCVILCSRNSIGNNQQCQQKIDCEDAASCNVQCSGSNTCKQIVCGEGPCDVTCSGTGSCGQVDCDQSCQCDVECGALANCGNLSCPGNVGQCNRIGLPGCDSSRSDACRTCP